FQNLDSLESEIKHLKFTWEYQEIPNNLVGYRLGEAYFKVGKYQNSLDVFEETLVLTDIPKQRKLAIENRIESCRFAIKAIKNPVSGEAKELSGGINTSDFEYWPSISIDGNMLIFTRLKESKKGRALMQEDFYSSVFTENEWKEAMPLERINTEDNEGAQTLSADGNIMFFAACNRLDGLGSCDIYFTRKVDGKWNTPQNAGAPVNSGSWESQPSLTANAGYLYFASNRTGGKGKMDIWRCRLSGFSHDGNPVWGNPENLGDSINSIGNENSPFIHFNGKDLYFTSDYWIGMGGKDIFFSKLKGNSNWSNPKNLGFPINSLYDEQGLVVDAPGTTAYYASDRDGNMDIYSFNLYPEIQPSPVTYVTGSVKDKITKEPLQAIVEFTELEFGKSESILTDQHGQFLMALPLMKNYAFNITKEEYLFYSESFNLKNVFEVSDPYTLDIYLQPLLAGSKIVLNNIYFETGSYQLLAESEPELIKLEELLENNQSIYIEIQGHTDNIGSEDYNYELSENRAKAVYDYLIKSGIEKHRLAYKGFGFSKPIAQNESEEGRSQNRRTEVRITQTN
ncbi:MAG: OmpA family protein, partial [Mariniphaga sp.]|nr:OmpA family protein [Mariniphaga sp.]